eukprot:CAMPEP_0196160266 /NCGR_PEP_ID=MMETSP0910-20130528/46740_1 /TAXON_ID=49265 /ORGANISM="Thalassiosira rotula, Strain GSO102" /LENGTH=732 /DNA_ID=CAMNT_0041425195 /DNA_START=21 /DNA_END=2219 /DNA_ORIENTATION=+
MNTSSNNNNGRGSSGRVDDGTQPPEPSIAAASTPTHTSSAASAAYDGAENHSPPANENEEMKLETDDDAINELPMQHDYAAMLHEADVAVTTKIGSEAEGNVNEAPMTDARIASQFVAGDQPVAVAAAAASGNRGEATALPANQRFSNERPPSPARPINNLRHQTSHERRTQQQQSAPPDDATTIPPPQSTPPTVSDEENMLPLPTLEATLVQSAEAILVDLNQSNASPNNNGPVYVATQIRSTGSPWWKRYKNYFIVALISVMATVIALPLINGNDADEVIEQPVEQTPPIATTPPPTSPQDTQGSEQPPVLPPSNPPTNETVAAIPTTAATPALETRPTSMPVPATLAPAPRPALSPMELLQSSALELISSEAIVPHDARENVAMYGDTAIVGAPNNNNERGFALVYVRDDGGEWSQQAKLEASDGADNDHFGWCVAIHGNTMIVSAYSDDDNGTDTGSVHVFVRNGGTWMHQAKLLAPDGSAYDYFGWTVAIFGDTVIVGAPGDEAWTGSAHLFVRNDGIWTHQAKLSAPDGSAEDDFGRSVGIFRDTVIVGAPKDSNDGVCAGSVHLFALDDGIWMHQAKLLAPDGGAKDWFGQSVGLFGDTAIVGAPYDDDDGLDSGSAQVFVLDNNIWTHQARIVAPRVVTGDQFGASVRIFGDTVIVGSFGDDDYGNNSGSLHLFTRMEGAWDHHAHLLAPKLETEFGQSVATYDGTVVAGSGGGEVYVFSSDFD